MEMLNIPPAQPQTNPKTTPQGKSEKGENQSFLKVMGKANQNAKNEQRKESLNSTEDKGTEINSPAQQGSKAKKVSHLAESAEKEEQAAGRLEGITAPTDCAMGAISGLPVESVSAELSMESVQKGGSQEILAENAKVSNITQLPPEASLQSAKAKETATVANVSPDTKSQNLSAENIASQATPTQTATTGMTAESLPAVEKNAFDSALTTKLAHETASTEARQKMSNPANVELIANQAIPDENLEQTSKQTGLMESSLGNLLQEVRPLREQSHGRQAANLSRGENTSIAIQTEGSAQVIAETQNEDSHPSFASKQENGFSALQADITANGTNSAINATPFETVLEGGMNGSPAAQQANQPLQSSSAEAGSIRLASGEFLSESQVVNQVLERISVDRAGNQSRIVIKMNPEELGEVKLALTMEKDQLRAHLLTQNHQVQEILEKHLPKLHEALSQQGVKLEDIQVGVDSNRHSGQEAFANHQQPESFRRHFNAPAGSVNNAPVQPITASAHSVSTQGLSLRI